MAKIIPVKYAPAKALKKLEKVKKRSYKPIFILSLLLNLGFFIYFFFPEVFKFIFNTMY